MTRIELDITKSVEENAAAYYEKAKKAKKKAEGAEKALEMARKKLEVLEREKAEKVLKEEQAEKKTERKRHWYEKFRWFRTSEGFLVVGGRDATTNEIVIKKHTDADDIVFHTDMAGSPFFVIKSEGKKVGDASIREVADATCSFSRAWKLGLGMQQVFYVKPEQVTKEAQAGEFLPKGAFMIRGKTTYIDNRINAAVGMDEDGAVMAGPYEAVVKHCKKVVRIEQGNDKASDVAKKIRQKIGGELDEILRALPPGNCRIVQGN